MSTIVTLKGGLGNQLFQISFGLYLSELLNDKVYFDVGWYKKDHKFNIARNLDSAFLMSSDSMINSKLSRYLETPVRNLFSKYIIYDQNIDTEAILKLGHKPKFLKGYFQNYEYPEAVWNSIKDKVNFKLNECFPVIFKGNGYLAVHIRAGDYLYNSKTRNDVGLSSFTYYEQATSILSKITSIKKLVIVTDSPEYVKNIGERFKTYEVLIMSSKDPLIDLSIISNAQGVVISNSTFSWWGAFIANKNHGAVIVAPKPWFNCITSEPRNLIPKEWILLEREII
jgi:hypothetical protein